MVQLSPVQLFYCARSGLTFTFYILHGARGSQNHPAQPRLGAGGRWWAMTLRAQLPNPTLQYTLLTTSFTELRLLLLPFLCKFGLWESGAIHTFKVQSSNQTPNLSKRQLTLRIKWSSLSFKLYAYRARSTAEAFRLMPCVVRLAPLQMRPALVAIGPR